MKNENTSSKSESNGKHRFSSEIGFPVANLGFMYFTWKKAKSWKRPPTSARGPYLKKKQKPTFVIENTVEGLKQTKNGILQNTQCFTWSMSSFKKYEQLSVWTAASTGLAATLTQLSPTVPQSPRGCPQALEMERRRSIAQLRAPEHRQPQKETHQPRRTTFAPQTMAEQRAPRPEEQIPLENASPIKVSRTDCLHLWRPLRTQQRSFPPHPEQTHWRHRQH